jgi:hypothetical protein
MQGPHRRHEADGFAGGAGRGDRAAHLRRSSNNLRRRGHAEASKAAAISIKAASRSAI